MGQINFRYFHMTNIAQILSMTKAYRWCAWDSNPWWQDGRRTRIHWAMAAPQYFWSHPAKHTSRNVQILWQKLYDSATNSNANVDPERTCKQALGRIATRIVKDKLFWISKNEFKNLQPKRAIKNCNEQNYSIREAETSHADRQIDIYFRFSKGGLSLVGTSMTPNPKLKLCIL